MSLLFIYHLNEFFFPIFECGQIVGLDPRNASGSLPLSLFAET